jgi:hypothetical protein
MQVPPGLLAAFAAAGARLVTTNQQPLPHEWHAAPPPAPHLPADSAGGAMSATASGSSVGHRTALKQRSGPKSKGGFLGVSQYKRTGRWEVRSPPPLGGVRRSACARAHRRGLCVRACAHALAHGCTPPPKHTQTHAQAHIWDSSTSTKGPTVAAAKNSKGKQLHLGSFPDAAAAARAYDRAALLLRGPDAALNYPAADYAQDPFLQELRQMSRPEVCCGVWVAPPRVRVVRCVQHWHRHTQPPGGTCLPVHDTLCVRGALTVIYCACR